MRAPYASSSICFLASLLAPNLPLPQRGNINQPSGWLERNAVKFQPTLGNPTQIITTLKGLNNADIQNPVSSIP
jgi:hypothetical protein